MDKIRRTIISLLIIVISLFTICQNSRADSSYYDLSRLDQGIISVNYSQGNASWKVRILHNNKPYVYELNTEDAYPLQMGNGKYTVEILEPVIGDKYRVVDSQDFDVNLTDAKIVYLQSIQMVDWNSSMNAIKKAQELTKKKKTELSKIEAIYQYIVTYYSYDNEKAKTVKAGYLPSIDTFYKKKSGICYDFASLMAAMLRSQGIPTKLLMGYRKDIDIFHAWNQVYLSDKKKWITIDTTYDAGMGIKDSMIKSGKDYTIQKIY